MALSIKMQVINLYPCDPGFRTGKRVFDYPYLLYVHSGKGRYQIGSSTYDTRMGDLLFCPPYMGNTILADDTDPFLLSGIEWTTHDPSIFRELPTVVNLLQNRFMQESIHKMIDEYSYGEMGAAQICDQILGAFVLECVRMGKQPKTDRQDISRELLRYIRENLDRPVNHKELERVFRYHKSSINRILQEATGLTLKSYQLDLRLKKAMGLLRYSEKPICEIAEECGYASAIFFSRQFREKTGLTPSEYRKPGMENHIVHTAKRD